MMAEMQIPFTIAIIIFNNIYLVVISQNLSINARNRYARTKMGYLTFFLKTCLN